MTGEGRLPGYLHVLRKHCVVLSVTVVAVAGAGVAYLEQQEAVYEAEALLRIEQPVPNLVGGRGGANWFAISQAALNTELFLLRKEHATAERAIAALEAAGVDTAHAGYTPESLSASVSVSNVPGTEGLVQFSLVGRDAATLPAAVNAYAAEYAKSTVKTRSRTYLLQRDAFERARDDAARDEALARAALDAFRQEHLDVDVEGGDNPAARERALLSAQLPELDRTALVDDLARRRIVDALGESGVEVVAGDEGVVLRATGATSVADALADSPFVAGLPDVRANPEVQRLRDRERSARERDAELERQGALPGHPERDALRGRIDEARSLRVRVIRTTLATELRDIAARAAHLARTQTAAAAAGIAEERVAAVLAGYRDLERALDEKVRARGEATTALRDLQGSFLSATGSAEGASLEAAGLRVEVRIPAMTARQVAPRVPLIIGLTAFAAVAAGLALAFVFEYLDDTIRSTDDLDRYVGLPLLGLVPRISSREHQRPDVAADSKPGSSVAEAFRSIRTSILFSRPDHEVRTVLITSAGAGEGKTTVATNLASVFARHRGPVLLVDADLRRPRVAAALGLASARGLTNVLVGEASLEDVVVPSAVPGLFVLTSGPIPPNPAELLHGEAMRDLLREAAERYRRVVVDTPPLVAVSDARVLAGLVDGFYLVISAGKTSRRLIRRAVESVAGVGVAVHGAILNNALPTRGDYHGYYGTDGGTGDTTEQ